MFQKQLMEIPEDHVLVDFVYSVGNGDAVVRFDGARFQVSLSDLKDSEESGRYYIYAGKLLPSNRIS